MVKCKCEEIRELLKRTDSIDMIAEAVSRGDRVEIVPSKEGAKILRVQKSEMKARKG